MSEDNKAPTPLEMVELTPEQMAARRKRNVAIALGLVGMVLLFYIATVVKLGPEVVNKPVL